MMGPNPARRESEDTVQTTETPGRAELVRRVAGLVPRLKDRALTAEEDRRLPQETIDDLAAAGLFRMRTPARYGGFESDARTLVDVGAELARGDGSTAWTASVYWIPTWMAGLFPDDVQDEVFSTPDVRVCGTLSPSATAVPVDDGYVVNGRWGFISGAHHSHWQEIIAMATGTDGVTQPVMALVPMAELEIVDDWDTTGMRGSGSVSTVATDLFVPSRRVLPLGAVLSENYASERNAASPMYRCPLLGAAGASSVGTVLGLAKAAREAFHDRLPGRKITYTSYDSQADAPITHLKVAEAELKIDEAEFHAHRLADLVDAKAAADEPWSNRDRARSRADVGAVCQLAKDAIDIYASGSGGSSVYRTVPIQRISRDVQTVNLHALMLPATNFELYGRILCGLDPNTNYL
jgi:alkylation response protein AidB-like acyl-CoA dehydrogenase